MRSGTYRQAGITYFENGYPYFTQGIQAIQDCFTSAVTPGVLVKGNYSSPNPWTYTVRDRTMWRGDWRQNKISDPRQTVRYYGWFAPGPSDFVPRLPSTSLAYNACLEKLNRKTRGDMDLSVDTFQSRQNLRMFKGIKKLLTFARGFSTKTLANGYLEWKYGWKPILTDIYDIANESVRYVLNKIERYKAVVSLPIEDQYSYTVTIYGCPVPVTVTVKGKASCTLCVRLSVPDFDLSRWTSLNAASITWELIPYSFVADWFYDVGSYLRGLETSLLYRTRFVSGFRSDLIVADSEEVGNQPGYDNLGYHYKFFGSPGSNMRYRYFNRTVLTSYPLPNAPKLNWDLSSSRLLSAAALLRQLIKD